MYYAITSARPAGALAVAVLFIRVGRCVRAIRTDAAGLTVGGWLCTVIHRQFHTLFAPQMEPGLNFPVSRHLPPGHIPEFKVSWV